MTESVTRAKLTRAACRIRRAEAADVAALASLKRTTFRETFCEDFAIPYAPTDLARFEAEHYSPAKVAAELADPAHATWLIDTPADPAAPPLGYAHTGPCKLPHDEVRPGEPELYQLYLRRAGQGIGLGTWLLDHILAALDANGGGRGRIWLGVWSGNARAQALYATRGFALVGAYRFPVGDWFDDERIMRRDFPGVIPA